MAVHIIKHLNPDYPLILLMSNDDGKYFTEQQLRR